MSTRGISFLHKWITNEVPETAPPDAVFIAELTHKLFADAKAVGIKRIEIDEDVESLYRVFVEAIAHLGGGAPE